MGVERENMKDWPEDWWKAEHIAVQFSYCFSECFLALGISYVQDNKLKYAWESGFLLQVGNVLFWLTAGHVLKDILKLPDESSVKVLNVTWNDDYENEYARGVPFSLDDVPAYIDENIDFGTIVIRKGYADPLVANRKVRPMTPSVWVDHDKARPEGYYLVGVPHEWTDYEEVGRTEKGRNYLSGAPIVCIPLERIPWVSGKEPNGFWDDPDAFYAKVLDVRKSATESLTSIKGMSGGPIVSIERTRDSELKYRLYGIQSEWLPDSRILKAEPIAKVAAIIRDWFDKAERRHLG